ncbi:amino acid decarboxylase [Amycolatopsis mediterranei S699]|uniref:Amino acid decarboxylase n=3 Tax=Amycolatopsis mediterranei TaxID=33910 RepID=A0A9R0NV59_AMYMS|nr:aminotransferase class V-fold PLP-dependent enzyme [Amycolatopsis mediterranei]ADJ44487.1 putative amino acid decarboxylase [Amycolatopsis mediterranei U32]AEK41225.1 amino acid decarboxylase [Amycolatopsis mediterranei S699]AFO76200.1 amino acid decarboxylase [Amycolatopsis mediterranei S699]AGT83329.1 amino acid decarboxylase [Amycolatopsis mediterranei RB]KDO07156.1 amino acid decarboxylase [Amycolatopsis mediterranei]
MRADGLAGGHGGADRLGELIPVALRGMAAGVAERGGPVPAGGPAAVAAALVAERGEPAPAAADEGAAGGGESGSSDVGSAELHRAAPAPNPAAGPGGQAPAAAMPGPAPAAGNGALPRRGVGAEAALGQLSRLLAAGSADPADPACAAHLHCPPLAVAVAADVVASALNPSMDSWDQAPVASELEREFTTGIARLCYPDADHPDAVVTTGGTESNLLGLLLARENGVVQPVCGANAHHSVARAAWLLGLPVPIVVPCDGDRLLPDALDKILTPGCVVVATAGTTNTGTLDPLPEIARICHQNNARLHVDAAYGGMALCSETLKSKLDGLDRADSVALDLHKFGWQPVAAGLFAAREAADLGALTVRAEYLNADDDTEAGLPDLLGRSIRTSRRPDAFRMAVTVHALGTDGLGALVERCCATATEVARRVDEHPGLRLWGPPELSTVVLRPVVADEAGGDELVARVRRALLEAGTAVIGRAALPTGPGGANQLWLKLTLLHPHATAADYLPLLDRIAATAGAELVAGRESPVAS